MDDIIDDLVESDFINEKRYSSAYARGKFINNHWGRQKILQEMRGKKINEKLIDSALKKIDEMEYKNTAEKLINRKWLEIKDIDIRVKKSKVYYFMSVKGYESDLIFKILEKMDQV